MDLVSRIEARKQLSFCSANILIENVNQSTTQESFILRLDLLAKNTVDSLLLFEIRSLLSSVKEMTPTEFAKLKQDTLQGLVIFPPDYIF